MSEGRKRIDADGKQYIRLGDFLKFHGIAPTGGQAKLMISDGMVSVNGQVEARRGRKLRHGDIVLVEGADDSMQVTLQQDVRQ